jgi:CDP-diacylglycerol--glycerol-3-phosphate 3-phosphatidyltransferase
MARIPISPPNQLTLLRILLTPVFVYFLFSNDPLDKQIALGIFIVAAITDWYDGYVARRWGYITRWGKFLDPLADKVLTSAAFLSFVWIGYAEMWMVVIIICRDFLITILRTYAEYKEKPMDTSYFAKTKTFAQLVVIYLFLVRYIVYTDPALSSMAGWFFDEFSSPEMMNVLMVIVTLMTAATGFYYFIVNWSILKDLITPGAYGTNNE